VTRDRCTQDRVHHATEPRAVWRRSDG